ncbi:MAG: hypothetical protein K2X39_06610, partial [Silvanigrellaceae bacterium]|nr:hypothetical protein [Silvanigrellaceae bacterium]
MPIYAYEPTIFSEDEEAKDCCYFELLQPLSEEPLTACLTCGHRIHRILSSFSIKTSSGQKNFN